MLSRRIAILTGGALGLVGPGAWGQPHDALPGPAGRVILTVTGTIGRTNRPNRAEFDLAMLEQLDLRELTTWTPWTDGPVDFEGVLARSLMRAVEARGNEVVATALNDYRCTIPVEDFNRYDVLLATRMNGAPLQVRDKGPIWVIYPWSEHPELNDMVTRRKSVWQLSRLHVR